MKLLELYDNLTNKNIFFYINQNKGNKLTWLNDENFEYLDLEYYLQVSGDKKISTIYQRLNSDNINEHSLDILSKIIINKFADNWDKMYEAIYADYDPIENYNSMEEESISGSALNKTKSNFTTVADNKNFGVNSAVGKLSSSNTTQVTGSEDDNQNSTESTTTRNLRRHGNIGVTTSQQMIESELVLREFKKNFYNLIYADVDSILTKNLY